MNIKKDDTVLVITGKYAGKTGKVIATSPKNGTVVVSGINMQKKAQKARKANEVSQIVEREGAIDASNVMVICDACSKAIRVKYNVEGGKKTRVCPKCGAVLDRVYGGKAPKTAGKEPKKKRERKRDKRRAAAEGSSAE